MAIIDTKTIESFDGIKKEIDKKSEQIVLDILQRGIYAYPIKSTVRELASNAHDAIVERDTSRNILLGKTALGDHYDLDVKTEGVFHSSGWDKSYYDLDWLSEDPSIYIKYVEGELRDRLTIEDNGVGLGGSRLFNYFTLNYSSKRTNKDTLGRWGLGSKVALSLGVDSFRVISRYNGMRFVFDVYLDKIESIVPKFKSDGTVNEYVLLKEENSYKAYWEPTTKKNGVSVSVEIKKHDKARLFEAVSEQLMYIKNIKFLHKKAAAITYEELPIEAEILYNNGSIIISKNSTYSKPHILLGTSDALINYGPVQFKELELEERKGSVGLIMNINDLEVTPSREAPIWSSKTRDAVTKKYNEIKTVASDYISESLKHETDYLAWIISINSIIYAAVNGSASIQNKVIAAFSSIVSLNEIKNVKFIPAPSLPLLRSYIPAKAELKIRVVSYNQQAKKITRSLLGSYANMEGLPIYFVNEGTVNRYTDRYILESNSVDNFIIIQSNLDTKLLSNPNRAILASKLLKSYSDIIVPDDVIARYATEFSSATDDDDVSDDVVLQAHHIDHEALRRQNQEIVISVYNEGVFSSNDVKIAELENMYNFKDTSIFHGTGDDREDMKDLGQILPSYIIENMRTHISLDHKNSYKNNGIAAVNVIPGRPIPKYFMILVSRANLHYIQDIKKSISVGNMVIKKYDKKAETVVFAKEIQNVLTAMLAVEYMLNYMQKVDSDVTYGDIAFKLRVDETSVTSKFFNAYLGFIDMFEDATLYSKLIKHAIDLLKRIPRNGSHIGLLDFLWNCMKLDSTKLYGDLDEFERDKILEHLNDNVPTSISNLIYKISNVELLDVKLFNDIIYYYSTRFANVELWRTLSIKNSWRDGDIKYINPALKQIKLTLIKHAI